MQEKVRKDAPKKKPLSQEQRSRRMQQIMFGALAVIMIFTMVISLVAR